MGFCGGIEGLLPVTRSRLVIQQRLAAVHQQVVATQADVVGIQEVDRWSFRSRWVNQYRALCTLYPYHHWATTWRHPWVPYPMTYDIRCHFGTVWAGQLVLSRWPLTNPQTQSLGKRHDVGMIRRSFELNRVAQWMVLHHPEGDYQLIHTHLEAFHGRTRMAQMQQLLDRVARQCGDDPVVLWGDWNAMPHTHVGPLVFPDEPSVNLGDDDTVDRVRQAGFSVPPPPFDFPATHPTRSLSYVGVRGGRVSQMGVLSDTGASDHLGVWATVHWGSEPPSQGGNRGV